MSNEIVSLNEELKIKVPLIDKLDENNITPFEVTIKASPRGIEIIAPEVEIGGTAYGYGIPIYVEQENGKLHLCVFDETTDDVVFQKRWDRKPLTWVFLERDDIDRHGEDCDCGLCNAIGKSYGVGIYRVGGVQELIERVYGPSEEAAFHNAKILCESHSYAVVDKPI